MLPAALHRNAATFALTRSTNRFLTRAVFVSLFLTSLTSSNNNSITGSAAFSISSITTAATPAYVTNNRVSTTTTTLKSAATTGTDTSSSSTDKMTSSSSSMEILAALRSKMAEMDMDVFLIPSGDPHLSEYPATAYARRAFVSKFNGSAGTAIVFGDHITMLEEDEKHALLYTDSRYFNEASMSLDSDCWTLMKAGLPGTPTIVKYLGDLAKKMKKEGKSLSVGIDPFVHAASFCKELEEALEAHNGSIKTLDDAGASKNIVDQVWGDDRPAMPTSPFRVHKLEYAGVSAKEKIEKVQSEMEINEVTLSVFTALDDVAYLLNVRASDVECNPVGISYCTVGLDKTTVYCDECKVKDEPIKKHLEDNGVNVAPYEQLVSDIKSHVEESTDENNHKVWIDGSNAVFGITRVVPKAMLHDKQNAITPMKACKNEAELEGMREAHIVDGVAMAEFISWLEGEILVKGRKVSEVEIDEVLCAARARQPGYIEPSFPTIAGVGSNGAIIHYRAKEDEIMKYLSVEDPILIDSGGQYEYGTTDVTRTWHFGEATAEFKDFYTRVLKGNIGVDSLIWPENTPGFVLDTYARKALWEIGADYGHGTGHGVGAALNVHEGPHSISPRFANKEVMKSGMIVSNEPGYYEDGRFGIRIENLLEVQPYTFNDEDKPSQKKFLKFSKLTLIPIQMNLIDLSLLTTAEMDWIDDYHETVLNVVGARMEDGSAGKEWLKKMCLKIPRS